MNEGNPAQQPEPNFSLFMTLTVFVVGTTSQTDKQTKLSLGQVRAPHETVYSPLPRHKLWCHYDVDFKPGR